MDRISNKLGVLIVTAFAVAITGCAQTIKEITRENHSVANLSIIDATTALQGAMVVANNFGKMWTIGSVSGIGFDYGEMVSIEDSRSFADRSTVGSMTTTRYKVSYHNEWRRYGIVFFAAITKIELRTISINAQIDLYGKNGLILVINIGRNNPEKYNKLLSALLVLCPYVK